MAVSVDAYRAGTALGIAMALLLTLHTVRVVTHRGLPDPVVPPELESLQAVNLPLIGSLASGRQSLSWSRDPFTRAWEASVVQTLEAAPVAADSPEPVSPSFEALGTAALGDGGGIALIRHGDSTRLYRSGQDVGNAQLTAVHDGFIQIALGDSIATFRVPK